ncbi:MAG TPA: signal recognition particle-docking protein FtsY [Rhizomicrobium sp.]|nr:signal recognition particle-docking protein FtsY [Rhizomicrobium sp.]
MLKYFGMPPPPPTLLERLQEGLSKSAVSLSENITGIFTKKKLDAAVVAELEEALIRADMGTVSAKSLAAAVARGRYDKEISDNEIREILSGEIAKVLKPAEKPFVIDREKKPFIVLVAGVNGTGKTTTIGKLSRRLALDGHKILLAAGDTFRAAAIEQLKIWAERTDAEIVARNPGADAAGLAYDSVMRAKEAGADVVLIDTAGRLQNKAGLMAELEKITRVLKKLDATAPHAALLVLDATTGQNAIAQVEAFKAAMPLTGLVMTKLDGTAKGGILVALAAKFGLPIHFIGVGEGVDDLQLFNADSFAKALTGAS